MAKKSEAVIGREYGLKDHDETHRVTLVDVIPGTRPTRARVLIRDRAIDGGRRQTSSEVVPVREVTLRRLRP